jgi:hypothetical protein
MSRVAVTASAGTQKAKRRQRLRGQGTASSVSKAAERRRPGGSYRASDKEREPGKAGKAESCKELLQEVAAAEMLLQGLGTPGQRPSRSEMGMAQVRGADGMGCRRRVSSASRFGGPGPVGFDLARVLGVCGHHLTTPSICFVAALAPRKAQEAQPFRPRWIERAYYLSGRSTNSLHPCG